MAEIKLQGVANTVTAGDKTATATSDASGVATVNIPMTEAEYNAVGTLQSRGVKSGYNDGYGQLTSLPPYAVAVASGIALRVPMSKRTAQIISASPMSYVFSGDGGTAEITVTAPDDSWTIVSTGVPATRNGNKITLTCPAGGAQNFNPLIVRWQSSDGWLYAEVALSRVEQEVEASFVDFSGAVRGYDPETGTVAPLSGATVTLFRFNSDGGEAELSATTTDASGDWAMTPVFFEWDNILSFRVEVDAVGYDSASATKNDIPSLEDAVANGIVISLIQLTKIVENIEPHVSPRSATIPASGGTVVLKVLNMGSSWKLERGMFGGNIIVMGTVTEDRTNNTISVTMPANPYDDDNGGGIAVSYNGEYYGSTIYQPPA